MGKGRLNRGNKRNDYKKPAGNKDETVVTFAGKRKEARTDGKEVAANVCADSINTIQMERPSRQILALENIDEKEEFLEEYDYEGLVKFYKNLGETIDISEMMIAKPMKSVYSIKEESDDYSLEIHQQDLNAFKREQYRIPDEQREALGNLKSELELVKKKQDIIFRETAEWDDEDVEEIQLSREEARQIKDSLFNWKKGEFSANERLDCDWLADYNEQIGRSVKNSTEGRKGKEYVDESTIDIQNFHSDKKVEDLKRKDDTDTAIYTKEKNIPDASVFQISSREYMAPLRSESEEQLKKDRESKSTVKIETPNPSSTEKRFIQAAADTETHDKTRVTIDIEDEEIEKETNSKSISELDERVVELYKCKEIDFAFEINGDKHISADGNHYSDSFEKKADMTFNYKDENILVSFTGNQILISTQNNEFNILVRNSNPTDLTNEATQIDSLP